MRALETLATNLKKLGHGGNHHPAANYNLSLYNKKRYSSNIEKYRRGGSLKKFQEQGEVNDVITPEVAVPVTANTQTEIPNITETNNGGGVHGRALYDGPLKDLNVHHFFEFANEDGTPSLRYKPEWIKDGVLDPEVDKWRSEKRGLSVSEIASWYISTQLAIPESAYENATNNSNWQGKNYGKIRNVKFDDKGLPSFDNNGRLIYNDFNPDKHDEFMQKSQSGDPAFSWYPHDFDNAFAMAHDMRLNYFFYNGEPFHAYTDEQTLQFEAKQKEADRIAKEKWVEYHSTNPSEQMNLWIDTKTTVKDKHLDNYGEDLFDRLKLSEMSEETFTYMLANNPEMMEFVDPDFETEKEALEFLQQTKGNPFGGNITVGGNIFLVGEHDDGNDLTGMYFDQNEKAYTEKLNNDWSSVSSLTNSQQLHNATARMGTDPTSLDGSLTSDGPVMKSYDESLAWLNQNDPNGRMYNWKTSYTNMGDKYIEFLPMVDAYTEGAKDNWFASLDHSSYEPDYVQVSADNLEQAALTYPDKFYLHSSTQYYDTPTQYVGRGRQDYKIDGEHILNPLHTNVPLQGQTGLESSLSFGNVFTWVTGGKVVSWAGKGLFNYGARRGIAMGGTDALNKIWSGARHPFKVGDKSRTFVNGSWQFTKNTAKTAFQPIKHLSGKYQTSWLNQKVLSPAIPGTYGVASGNTAFNGLWGYNSYNNAKRNFAEGDYLWGTANALFTGLNVAAPYFRYKHFSLIDDAIAAPNKPYGIHLTEAERLKGPGGSILKFRDPAAMGELFKHGQTLPSARLRNYAPNIFGWRPTQTSILKDINDRKNALLNTQKIQQNTNILKFNPK